MIDNVQIIILAAGNGTRMKSDFPKVMHMLGKKSMLEHVIDNCCKISSDLILVYSDHIKKFLPLFSDKCDFVKQEKQLGTAHAVSVAKHKLSVDKPIAVIYGDNPLISSQIIQSLFDHMQQTNSKAVTLAFEYEKPNVYGRIVVDADNNLKKIVEAKFANENEKKITLCNSGVMSFAPNVLNRYIDGCLKMASITDGSRVPKELYLTEIVELCVKNGEKVSYCVSKEHNLVLGVNTQEELKNANTILDKQ